MSDCPCGNPEGTNKECERCRLIAEIARLKTLASEAIDGIEEWAVYASEYFREKHRLEEHVRELRERLNAGDDRY